MTATSSTLIDVTLTNRPRSFLMAGTFDLGLSDHHLVYAVSKSHCPKTCPIIVERRTFKNYDLERFRDDLHLIPFDVGSITSRCSGNEPALTPEETAGRVDLPLLISANRKVACSNRAGINYFFQSRFSKWRSRRC